MSQAAFCYLPNTGDGSPDLTQTLADCAPWLGQSDDLLAILERADRIFFDTLGAVDDLALWPEGRVFGAG
ncbi:MAG: hypothetical protein R2856_23325 [Caldilineaceae bacterium]